MIGPVAAILLAYVAAVVAAILLGPRLFTRFDGWLDRRAIRRRAARRRGWLR